MYRRNKNYYSPYIKFCIDKRPEVVSKFPNASPQDIISMLGQLWNDLKKDYPEYLERKYGYVEKI